MHDLSQFIRSQKRKTNITLVGHSAGGGLALRVAGSQYGNSFNRYIIISPMLHRNASTVRSNVTGWAKPFKVRYVGLTVLDRFGIRQFENLPVLAFAVPPDSGGLMTRLYSYRLSENFTQNAHYLDDLLRASRPMEILVGAEDEMFYADRFEALVHSVRQDISVHVLPGMSHMGMILEPAAIKQIVAALHCGA